MSTSKHREIRTVDDLEVIVDTDAHLNVSYGSGYLEYLDEPWRNVVTSDRTSFSFPTGDLFKNLGGKTAPDRVETPEKEREYMDEFGLDYAILTSIGNLTFPVFSNDRFVHAMARAYNDWLVDTFLDESDEFHGLASITTHQPDKTAEEIDRVGDHPQIVGVSLGSVGILPALGNRRYDPIYEALVDNDLPLVLHGTTGTYASAHSEVKRALDSYWELHIVSHPFGQTLQLTSMIGQGVPERYPDLDVVFQEGGLGWIPTAMYRMDGEYEKRRQETPLLTRRPSEYITDPDVGLYFTSQPVPEARDPKHLAWMIEMFNGQENLMYSSDLPHYDFDSPSEVFGMLRPHMDDRALRNIFGETALRVFDL